MVATAKELRFNTSALLKAVALGEDVVITFRGKPAARLVSLHTRSGAKAPKVLKGFGMWKDRADLKEPKAWVRQIRKGRGA